MGVLTRGFVVTLAGLAALAGCYSPSLRDCTVACVSPSDCAGDQVCGKDGLCAAPAVADQCGSLPDMVPIDAAPDDAEPAPSDAEPARDAAPPHDAAPLDAAMPPDAAIPTLSLRVRVEGKGSIVVNGVGTCSSETAAKGDCTYIVPVGIARTVRAIAVKSDERFARWTSLVCFGQGSTCTFTPLVPTSISARFERDRVEVR
jgi:hypothetical protein